MSPSLRRVWVEIEMLIKKEKKVASHPPCGGCGLKYMEGGGAAAATGVTLLAEGVG